MGSSAWKSEDLASLAVPSALSPSTMNSSERATSSLRQSASLVGNEARLESVLAPRDLLLLAGGQAGAHLGDDLVHQQGRLCLLVTLCRGEHRTDLLLDDPRDDGPDGCRPEDLLRLPLELGLGETDRQHRCQARQDVVLLDTLCRVLGRDLEASGVGLDSLAHDLEQTSLEAGQVRPALGRRDDVDEAAHLGLVARAPAQGQVDLAVARDLLGDHVPAVVEDRDGLLEAAGAGEVPRGGHRGVRREELDEVDGPAVVHEGLLVRAVSARGPLETALVPDGDRQPGDEERGLAHSGDQLVVGEHGGLGEHLAVGPVAHPGARRPPLGLADDREARRC